MPLHQALPYIVAAIVLALALGQGFVSVNIAQIAGDLASLPPMPAG